MGRFIESATMGEELFSELLRRVGKIDSLREEMMKMGMLAAYRCTEPEFTVWLDTRDGKYEVGVGEPGDEPGVSISYSADVAHQSWLNKLNATMAMTRGTIKVTGSITALLRFVPLQSRVAEVYAELLVERGLAHLQEA
ncbi:MAG: SCP2 sterol-binding domain-containing protein [Actinomycetota bacterium]